MKIRVIRIVEKLFITPEMPKILKETLQIQSAVNQGTDKLSRIIFFKINYIQCDKFIWYGYFINRLHSVWQSGHGTLKSIQQLMISILSGIKSKKPINFVVYPFSIIPEQRIIFYNRIYYKTGIYGSCLERDKICHQGKNSRPLF